MSKLIIFTSLRADYSTGERKKKRRKKARE
nr:MAG TPA: hypothetical protein [Caudoviricetes sp.]